MKVRSAALMKNDICHGYGFYSFSHRVSEKGTLFGAEDFAKKRITTASKIKKLPPFGEPFYFRGIVI